MNKYLGSCHCSGVRFEILSEAPLGPQYFRCSCSLCSRKGAVIGVVAQSALKVTAGADLISIYAWNTGQAQHYFCKVCGIHTHYIPRGSGDRLGISMACIEGVDVYALDAPMITPPF